MPENNPDSGESFPGSELKPRRRKSRTPYGVGRKPAAERTSRSFCRRASLIGLAIEIFRLSQLFVAIAKIAEAIAGAARE